MINIIRKYNYTVNSNTIYLALTTHVSIDIITVIINYDWTSLVVGTIIRWSWHSYYSSSSSTMLLCYCLGSSSTMSLTTVITNNDWISLVVGTIIRWSITISSPSSSLVLPLLLLGFIFDHASHHRHHQR